MKRSILLFTALLVLFTSYSAHSSDFEDELRRLAEENGKLYVGPAATAFGTGMNSGLYHTAKTHKLFGFDVGVKMAYTIISDDDKTFDWVLGDQITIDAPDAGLPDDELTLNPKNIYTGDLSTPTLFGEDQAPEFQPLGAEDEIVDALRNAGKTDQEIDQLRQSEKLDEMVNRVPTLYGVQGFNIDGVPLAIPQVSVGLIMSTEVMLRWIPEIDFGDYGKFNYFGIGVKHSLSQYIPVPMFPVSISGQFAYQSLTLGDILESSHIAFGVHASKTLGIGLSVTPYLGLAYESSTVSVAYEVTGTNSMLDGQNISFEIEGDNNFRMTGGLRFGLPLITINADYSLGAYQAVTAGIGITFR